jgi:hypothetical protein
MPASISTADQVEPPLRAGRDQHLRRIDAHPVPGHAGRNPVAQRPVAFARRVLQPSRGPRAARARRDAHRLIGNVSGDGRPPAIETMPGCSVSFRISRITDGFMRAVRRARRQKRQFDGFHRRPFGSRGRGSASAAKTVAICEREQHGHRVEPLAEDRHREQQRQERLTSWTWLTRTVPPIANRGTTRRNRATSRTA